MEDCYTELERAVVILVENFYKYVSKHSLVKNKISKSSFRKMLQKELNHMLTVWPPHGPHTQALCLPGRPLSSQSYPPTHYRASTGPGSCPGGLGEGGPARSQ